MLQRICDKCKNVIESEFYTLDIYKTENEISKKVGFWDICNKCFDSFIHKQEEQDGSTD